MDKDYLTLKRASASRPSGEWRYDDYDVIADGVVVGRIMKAAAAPVGQPWMWTLVLYHREVVGCVSTLGQHLLIYHMLVCHACFPPRVGGHPTFW